MVVNTMHIMTASERRDTGRDEVYEALLGRLYTRYILYTLSLHCRTSSEGQILRL